MGNQIESIPYPVKVLKPIPGKGVVPKPYIALEFLVSDIVQVLEQNQWKPIDSIQYLFEFCGWTTKYFTLYLEEIRGPDFIIGFTGNQGAIDNDWIYDTAGFNVLVVKGLAIRFNDFSPLTVWKCKGDKVSTAMRNPSSGAMLGWEYKLSDISSRDTSDIISNAIHSLTPIRNRLVRLYFIQNEWFGLCNILGLRDIILDYAF